MRSGGEQSKRQRLTMGGVLSTEDRASAKELEKEKNKQVEKAD